MKPYSFEVLADDPNKVRLYTLDNGLKVYLAQNFDNPRIQTYIPVRTGSNNDPKDNTGLAHYLEHMMFKGSSKIGTLDWNKEKPLLDRISDLYEEHKAAADPEEKKRIYKEIDETSQEAAGYAIANEYDKLLTSIGASGTNAHTWFDETVYKNNIPTNELEKWLQIESERFSELVLRLFHTELEAVYEEFNRAQDDDSRLVHYAMLKALFPTHPNGQQTTLGSAEHLRNPSMKAIHAYFDTYYVPNNFALVLVGDLDFDRTISLIDQYFGSFKFKALPQKEKITEVPLNEIQKVTVKSPSLPRLQIAWRTDSYGTEEARLAEVASQILSNNGEVGLLDVNLNQAQKVLRAVSYNSPLKEYGYISAVVVPKPGQSLQEAEELLLAEIEKLKNGDFPDWLIPAIALDTKLYLLQQKETAKGLAELLYQAFINERSWEEELQEPEKMGQITKEALVRFAKDFFGDNYVIVYKEQGENEDLIKVENPGITPVPLNKTDQSEFFKKIQAESVEPIAPVFIDYQKEIEERDLNAHKVSLVKNALNNLAEVSYIFDMGTDHDRTLDFAFGYLSYLGTDQYSAEALKAEFYKLGIAYDCKVKEDSTTISLSGPEENIAEGLKLVQHWITKAISEEEVYQDTVQTLEESRLYAKNDKKSIARALNTYAKLGKNSRFLDRIKVVELRELNPEVLLNKLRNLFKYPYQVYFYGRDFNGFMQNLAELTEAPSLEIPTPREFTEPETTGQTFFCNYDMVQVELTNFGQSSYLDTHTFGAINVFNEYFGSGLSSIVFQEIRESRSLAYSAYANYSYPQQPQRHDYLTTYIGTQLDKMDAAVGTMNELLKHLPKIDVQFQTAKENVLKKIASNRITRRSIFKQYLAVQKYGIQHDIRRDVYEETLSTSWEDLEDFYRSHIQQVKFNTALLGSEEALKKGHLQNYTRVTLEDIFGY